MTVLACLYRSHDRSLASIVVRERDRRNHVKGKGTTPRRKPRYMRMDSTFSSDSETVPSSRTRLKIKSRRDQTHLYVATHLSRRIHPRSSIADDSVVLPRVCPGQRARRSAHARESRLARLGGLTDVASRPCPAILARATRRRQVREGGSIGQGARRALKDGAAAGRLGARRAAKAGRAGAGGAVRSPVVFARARHGRQRHRGCAPRRRGVRG